MLVHSYCNTLVFCDLRRQPCAVQTECAFLSPDAFQSIGGTCPGSCQALSELKLYSQQICSTSQTLAAAVRRRGLKIPTTSTSGFGAALEDSTSSGVRDCTKRSKRRRRFRRLKRVTSFVKNKRTTDKTEADGILSKTLNWN